MASETKSRGKRRAVDMAIKERQALELRKAGMQLADIAERLGYANASGAYKAIQRALTSTLQEPADELRAIEIQRLDRMLLAVWKLAVDGDVKAVDRVLRIVELRSKILGLATTMQPSGEDHALSEIGKIGAALAAAAEALSSGPGA